MIDGLDAWFKREILAHEAALVRYLMRCWRNADDLPDIRQEVYARVYEAAARARPTFAKSFLFSTARHLLMDRLRRKRIVSIEAMADLDALNVLVDEVSPERRANARQELKLLAEAFAALPPKCRQVVWLRRVDQISQKEVAARLGITQSSVEKHVIKGMRLLAGAMHGKGASILPQPSQARGDPEHGQQRND